MFLCVLFASIRCDDQGEEAEEMISNSGYVPLVADLDTELETHQKRGTSGSRLTYEERVDFLKAHNDYRRNVNPPASDMQFMVSTRPFSLTGIMFWTFRYCVG